MGVAAFGRKPDYSSSRGCFQIAKTTVLLAPGFSPVWVCRVNNSRFNGFFVFPEAAEAAETAGRSRITGLKPGANERKTQSNDFENTP
jgi:hypothetical protein